MSISNRRFWTEQEDSLGVEAIECLFSKRNQIFEDIEVKKAINEIWDIIEKDENLCVSRDGYLAFFQRIAKVLLTNLSNADALVLAERDWLYDSVGAETLDYDLFCNSIFEMADIICPSINPNQYAMMLYDLRNAIACKESQNVQIVQKPESSTNNASSSSKFNDILPFHLRKLEDIENGEDSVTASDNLSKLPFPLFEHPSDQQKKLSLKQLIVNCHISSFKSSEKSSPKATLLKSSGDESVREENIPTQSKYSFNVNKTAISQRLNPVDAHSANDFLISRRAPRICVIGPPCSGKSTLARHLATTIGLQLISEAEIVNCAIKHDPDIDSSDNNIEDTTSFVQTEKKLLDKLSKEIVSILRRGQSAPKELLLKAMILKMISLLKLGAGFIADDVSLEALSNLELLKTNFPNLDDISPITINHVIQLELSAENCEKRIGGLFITSSELEIYSSRDIAVLSEESLELKGYSEIIVKPTEFNSETSNSFENDSPQDNDAEEIDIQNESDVENSDMAEVLEVPPQEESYLTKISPTPLSDEEEFLPYKSIAIQSRNIDSFCGICGSSPSIEHVVHINAGQSAHSILEEAIFSICKGYPSILQIPPSLMPVQISISPAIESSSRAEKLRWLLYGDIDEVVKPDFQHLIPANRRRYLSILKTICPVKWSTGEVVEGEPEFCAAYAGRIYLFSSKNALERFLASPFSFLSFNTVINLKKKIWIVDNAPSTHRGSINRIAALLCEEYKFLNINALPEFGEVIKCSNGNKIRSSLRKGELAKFEVVMQTICQARSQIDNPCSIKSSNGWVLHGIPATESSFNVLKSHDILPDVIIFLRSHEELNAENVSSSGEDILFPNHSNIDSMDEDLSVIRSCVSDTTISVIELSLFTDISESINSIKCALNIFHPRIDIDLTGGNKEPISEAEGKFFNELGKAGRFCPVTWKCKKRLIPGSDNYELCFDQLKYCFIGEVEMKKFNRNPSLYLPSDDIGSFAPIILLLGVSSCGKRVLGSYLKDHMAVHLIHNDDIKDQYIDQLIIESASQNSTIDDLDNDIKLNIYFNIIEKAIELAEAEAAKSNNISFIILNGLGESESSIPSADLLEKCLTNRLLPVKVFHLVIDEDTSVKRLIKNWKFSDIDEEESDDNLDKAAKLERLNEKMNEAKLEEVDRIKKLFEEDCSVVETAKEFYLKNNIDLVEIDATTNPCRTFKNVKQSLLEFVARADSIFSTSEILSRKEAGNLLRSGYVSLGKAGIYCPVMFADKKNLICTTAYPVLYKNGLYFPSSASYRKSFVSNPEIYLKYPISPCYIPPTCAIMGPPLSGKTTVADFLCKSPLFTEIVKVSIHDAIEWVGHCGGGTVLWDELAAAKGSGKRLENDLLVRLLKMRLDSSECKRKGWVIDGYPNNENEALLLRNHGIVPQVMIMIQPEVSAIIHRMQYGPKISSEEQIISSLREWHDNSLILKSYYASTFGCNYLKAVNGSKSIWNVCKTVEKMLALTIQNNSLIHQTIALGNAASILGCPISKEELKASMRAEFQNLSPSLLSENKYLISNINDRNNIYFYDGNFFWLSLKEKRNLNISKDLDNLIQQSESYIEARNLSPVDISIGTALAYGNDIQIAFKEYCPVSYQLGKGPQDWPAIVKGSRYILAAYKSKVYCFTTEEKRRLFIENPGDFCNLELPKKLPPLVRPPSLNSVPAALEQKLSKVLNEVLIIAGSKRLKYPSVSAKKTAILHIALLLKANNPNHSQQKCKKNKRLLLEFENDCELVEYIKNFTPCGGAVHGIRAISGKDALIEKAARFDIIIKSEKCIILQAHSIR